MKWIYLCCILFICSCGGGNNSSNLSSDQQALFTLADTFQKEYRDTTNSNTRQQLRARYEMELQNYLTRSRAFILDFMKVKMKRLDIDPKGKVFAEFADAHYSYTFRREYNNDREMKTDVVYRLIDSINKDSEVQLRFLCSGSVKINDPSDASVKNFEIDVVPTAIKSSSCN